MSKEANPWVAQAQGNKSTRVESTTIMLIKVRMPSLVNIMSICQWEELNIFERSTCSWYCPTWKPTSQTMAAKVSRITSWVPMHSLPWIQHKRLIPIGLMDVCTHIKKYLQLSDGAIQVIFETLWKKLKKLVKSLGKLVEL